MPISDPRVRLVTDNTLADILLINSQFQVVARGPSPLEASVPPGLYAAKVKVGDEETEKMVALRPSPDTLDVRLEAPRFSSPIPLHDTRTSREYHQNAVARFLRADAPRTTLGNGASVMLCVRDPSKRNFDLKPEERDLYAKSFRGFRLRDSRGALIVDLDRHGEFRPEEAYMAARVDLDPGSYVLSHSALGRETCVSLTAVRGWTLQAYLQLIPVQAGSVERRPDFRDMALAFSHINQGFDPKSQSLKFLETVRKGLLEGRNYVKRGDMEALLHGKFEDPILGLYGAHLLLLDPEPDLDLVEIVVQNTAAMLGEAHPDVVALAFCLRERGKRTADPRLSAPGLLDRMAGPPLLSRSWDPLLEAARRLDPSLLSRSPAFRMAGNLLDQGVYFTWAEMPVETGQEALVRKARVEALIEDAPASGTSLLPALLRTARFVWKHLHPRPARTRAGPPPVADFADIHTLEQAVEVLRWIAASYDWDRLLPRLRAAGALAGLTALQRDLLKTLRTVDAKDGLWNDITPEYLKALLESHRVPIESLARALSGIEAGGYLAGKVGAALRKTR